MPTILTRTVAILSITAGLAAHAQEPATVADFAGTWNVTLMSHQVALVIEPAEGNTVTATMMMMGNDIPLKGELVGRTITLIGAKPEGATDDHPNMSKSAGKPITATLQADGTLAGELMTNNGPATWTGEKLRTRGPAARDSQANQATVAGTWAVSLMSHQMALVLTQDGTAVAGTLTVGQDDFSVEGTFTNGKLSISGENAFNRPGPAGSPAPPARMILTAVMVNDDTLDGELNHISGPLKWTAERLRKRK